ncbi:MAG: S8 family peptidase [Vicinamibacterales bacterium]
MKNPGSKAVWGAVLALAMVWPSPSAAGPRQPAKLDNALQRSVTSGGSFDVIVRAKPGRGTNVKATVGRHTSEVHVHGLINAVSARLSARDIAALANDPEVDGISLNADVSASASTGNAASKKNDTSGGSSPTSPNLSTFSSSVVADLKQALGLDNRFTGVNATVAIIDSGIAMNVDFDTRIVAQYAFLKGRQYLTIPYDDYGHGTHVAGLIGSSGASSNNKYAGIAPGARLLSLKVLDGKGTGKTTDVINAIEFAIANKARFGLNVINLSLGHPIYESAATDPLIQAVEAAVRAGIVVVVAAGNYGYNPVTGQTGYAGIASPGNAPSAITVGAGVTNNTLTRADDRLADYSSRGPTWYDGFAKPDLLAPGQSLVSTDAVGSMLDVTYPSLVLKSGYAKYLRLSGSSMATGVVSGLVAVMFDANRAGAEQRWQDYQNSLKRNQREPFPGSPSLTVNAVKALLEYSATPLRSASGDPYNALEQGAGLVNGIGAVTLAYNIDTTRAAGQYWLMRDTTPSTEFAGVAERWSQTVIWGTALLRGTSVVDLRQTAWADNIVWGTGAFANVVSGMFSADEDNIVWGTLALDEDNIVWGTSVPLSSALMWAGNAILEDNIVWGTAAWAQNIVWGSSLVGYFNGQAIVWGTLSNDEDNIVWGTLDEDNIVWGTFDNEDNIVWGTSNHVSALAAMVGGSL